MSPDAVFWLAVGGLVATCVAAIGARSLAEFSRHELEEICQRRNAANRLGQILLRHDEAGLAAETLQVIATAVVIGAGTLWAWLDRHQGAPLGWLPLSLILGVGALLLLAAEIWAPRAIARLWAEPILYWTWPFWRGVGWGLAPLVLGARFVDTVLHRMAGRMPEVPDEESFEDEIRTIVTEGLREGLLEEDAREMIEGVIELSDVHVSEVMTPRTDMVSMSAALPWNDVLKFVTGGRHTRIPVFRKTRDDIIGILYAKDLLPVLVKQDDEPSPSWTALLREPYFVPETKPVDDLLQEFQRNRTHMAVVLDEYGGVSGLVTLEDVLEEIVGEIIDEYDKDLVDGIRQLNDTAAEVLARVHIDEINERLQLHLPEEGDFDTIGGFVFSELGHVPVAGEELCWQNVHITVLEATARRIERVRIEVRNGSEQATA